MVGWMVDGDAFFASPPLSPPFLLLPSLLLPSQMPSGRLRAHFGPPEGGRAAQGPKKLASEL